MKFTLRSRNHYLLQIPKAHLVTPIIPLLRPLKPPPSLAEHLSLPLNPSRVTAMHSIVQAPNVCAADSASALTCSCVTMRRNRIHAIHADRWCHSLGAWSLSKKRKTVLPHGNEPRSMSATDESQTHSFASNRSHSVTRIGNPRDPITTSSGIISAPGKDCHYNNSYESRRLNIRSYQVSRRAMYC